MLDKKAIMAALAGLLFVGSFGTYVVLENSGQDVDTTLIKTEESSDNSDSAVSSEQVDENASSDSASDVASGAAPATEESDSEVSEEVETAEEESAEPQSPTANWRIPSFDTLRVEPDGSTVIAGQAEPNTKIMLMNGDEVIATTDSLSVGDFAIILDEPLDGGEYQLSLRAEDADGNFVVSEQTGVVNVPEDGSAEELLVMIMKPGEATEIISQPEVAAAASEEEKIEVAVAEENSEADEQTPATSEEQGESNEASVVATLAESVSETAQNAAGNVVENAQDAAKEVAEDAAEAAEKVETAIADTGAEVAEKVETAIEETEAEVAENVEEAATDVADATKEVMDAAKEKAEDVMASEQATETGGDQSTVADAASEADAASAETADTESTEGANTEVASSSEEEAVVAPKVVANVRIEAVEVEGDKLFVAGLGTKGNKVRVFADGEEVGVAEVDANGRFLLETEVALSVGEHMIAAALVDSQDNVLIRAIVPFVRPETDAAAAVASNETGSSSDEQAASQTNVESDEDKEIATTNNEAEQVAEGSSSSGEVATSEDNSSTSSDATASADNATSDQTVADSDSSSSDSGASTQAQSTSSDGATEENEVSEQASNPNEPETIVQDSLTPASSQSVIIRKGDTLWHIARRTYGAGVRYTTIYLANQEQIENPDDISPGQIFEVPEKALENAEELHRERIQGNR